MALARQARFASGLMWKRPLSSLFPSNFDAHNSKLNKCFVIADRGFEEPGCVRPCNSVSGLMFFRGYMIRNDVHPWTMPSGLSRINEYQVYENKHSLNAKRFYSMKITPPPHMAKRETLQLSLVSPGVILEPYSIPEPISFLKRWFTREGWKRTKQDIISEFKTAFAIAKLRQLTKYSRPKFYEDATQMYKQINSLLAEGDQTSLRHLVTEKMYSILKRELKQRESVWHHVHWEMIEPAVRIRTLRARMMAVDPKNLDHAFVQITLEILTRQKFAAYDSKRNLIAGDKDKSILVKDVWIFERSLFHPDAKWRVCARLTL